MADTKISALNELSKSELADGDLFPVVDTTAAETKYLDASAVEVRGQLAGVNTQTGTTYTLVLTDVGKVVEMNNASANTLTIPTNASVAFPIGSRIDVVMYGAGTTTVDATTGVTLNGVSSGGASIQARYAGVSLYKRATDEWIMLGNHGAVA